jgi:ATP-dependent helicase HrpB
MFLRRLGGREGEGERGRYGDAGTGRGGEGERGRYGDAGTGRGGEGERGRRRAKYWSLVTGHW